MFAVTAARIDADDPLAGLELGERPDPSPPDGWTTVTVRAAALNHHDVWTLRGVGISPDRLPIVLGCDAAGVDEDGHDVIVHAVIGDPAVAGGDETLDPRRSLLSERYDGTFAERVAVPRRNLVPMPGGLSYTEAACLPTAYLTAYRMLFTRSGLQPGATILVQGAGAVSRPRCSCSAAPRASASGRPAAMRPSGIAPWNSAPTRSSRPGPGCPERVNAVMESVGEATWAHSLRALKPGGRIVVCGATSGAVPPADLNRVFFLQLSVVGSTMGTRDELERLATFLGQTGVRPKIDRTMPLEQARDGFAAMIAGDLFGKVVFTA